MIERIRITNEIFVDNVTYDETCAFVDNVINNKFNDEVHFIFAQNPFKVAMASKNTTLMNALESADILIPDGIGIIIAARLKKFKLYQRVTGVDLMYRLISLANNKGYKIFFLGGKPGIAEQAVMNLKIKFPYLKVVGTSDGYFSDENSVIEKINSSSPDVLFVCMGSPLQELFIYNNKSKLHVPICMGGGGSLDVYAGYAKRAPRIFQIMGLEWLYRLLREPKRIKRFIFGYSTFFFLIINGLFLKKNHY